MPIEMARFPAGRNIIKLALSAALKPTAARDLESRSKPCLGRLFPKKKTLKVNRHFNERNKRKVKSAFFAFFDFIFPGEGQYGTVYRATATGLRGQVQPCKVLCRLCFEHLGEKTKKWTEEKKGRRSIMDGMNKI